MEMEIIERRLQMPDKCLICGEPLEDDEPCSTCLEFIEQDWEEDDDFSAIDYGDINEDGYEYDH